jgi:hypothetical protein
VSKAANNPGVRAGDIRVLVWRGRGSKEGWRIYESEVKRDEGGVHTQKRKQGVSGYVQDTGQRGTFFGRTR